MPDVKFSNQYPYTDFHELNLDWVIKEVKYWSTKVGKTIQSIELTGTVGLVDTYTINYSDGSTSTFDVTNGNGIASVAKTGTAGLVDTYTITFQDGSTTTFEVTNGAAAVDPTLTLSDYAADAKATGDAIRAVDDKLDDYIIIDDPDLLVSLTPVAGKYLNPSDGSVTDLTTFYTYVNIDISRYKNKRLYPRSNDTDTYNTMRSYAFYSDALGTYISGASGTATIRDRGISVPANAEYISICFRNNATQAYLYDEYVPETNYILNPDIIVDDPDITDQKRFASVCFEFDDGVTKDEDVKAIFDTFGYKCGFALISNNTDYARYLGFQGEGFEILSHSTDATGMNDPSVSPSVIEGKLADSKTELENKGYIINGFVTPNSTMNAVFLPLLRKYYQYAETVYMGAYTAGQSYLTPTSGVYNGFRISLQTTTLANQKLAVDKAVQHGGCITFYGHAASLDTTDYLTTTNLTDLLTYIKTYVDNGDLVIGTPYKVKSKYFSVKNDDVSDGWISVADTTQNVDSRLTVTSWDMKYNPKLGLISFCGRFKANEAISGNFDVCELPVTTPEWVLRSESKTFLFYSGYVSLTSGGTWAANTNIRISGICPYRKIKDSLI